MEIARMHRVGNEMYSIAILRVFNEGNQVNGNAVERI